MFHEHLARDLYQTALNLNDKRNTRPNNPNPLPSQFANINRLVKGRWAPGGEDGGSSSLGDAMWKWELEVLGEELLDIRALDVLSLLELNDLEDLYVCVRRLLLVKKLGYRTWMERKRER